MPSEEELNRIREERMQEIDKALDRDMKKIGTLDGIGDKMGWPGSDADYARQAKLKENLAALNKTPAQIKGLPIAGYAKTQPPEVIAASQELKYAEERFYRLVEKHLAELGADGRDTALAKTYAQIAFSTAVRALMKPQRIDLPEDGEKPVDHGQIDMEASRGGTGEE